MLDKKTHTPAFLSVGSGDDRKNEKKHIHNLLVYKIISNFADKFNS